MKHFFSILLCSLVLGISCAQAPENGQASQTDRYGDVPAAPAAQFVTWSSMPAWQEGYFEIHSIATGKGEALLIVMPDGTTILTDSGDTTGNGWESDPLPDDSRTPGQWIAKYIKDYLGRDYVDYFFLSHFHGDHFGATTAQRPGPDGYKLCGVTDVAQEISFGSIVDRGYPAYDFPDAKYMKQQPMANYVAFVRHMTESRGQKAEQFIIGSKDQFAMKYNAGAYKDFSIRNLAGNARIWMGRGLKTRPMYEADDDPNSFDENMFSCCQLFTYGSFSYFQGGDLPGGYWVPSKPTPHLRTYDAQVADLIGHPVTVVKASHHATRDSSSPHFLWTLRPQVVVVESSNPGHPTDITVERMLDPLMPGCKDIYVNAQAPAERLGPLWDRIKGWGHIIIRVAPHGESYEIFVVDAFSTCNHKSSD